MVEYVIQMSTFQRRFHWMLSSLWQQEGAVPDFRLRVDTDINDPFREANETLRACWDDKLDIQWIEHDDKQFRQRGFLRDQALQESDADWLLFSDADILYAPTYLAHLNAEYLLPDQYRDAILSAVRLNMTADAGDALMTVECYDYTKPIEDAYATALQARNLYPRGESIARATGYFQLCRREEALKRGTYYRDANPADKPLKGRSGGNYGSDCQFRRGWRIVAVNMPPLVHIFHGRTWKDTWDGGCR